MTDVLVFWLCGAAPLAAFILLSAWPDATLGSWLAFFGIVLFWPIFVAWALWPSCCDD